MGVLKKWSVAILCIAMACMLCACSFVTVNEERNKTQTVATVNGVDIKKETYEIALMNLMYNYSMTEDMLAEDEKADSYRESALDAAIDDELLYQKALEDGIVDNSEEKRAEIEKSAQESLYSMLEYYREQAAEEGVEDPEAEALKRFSDYRDMAGMTDMEAYIDKQVRSNAINAIYEQIIGDVTYTEEQAKEYYDLQVASQAPLIEQDASNYNLYKSFGDVFVNPAGFKYVKNLLITIPEDKQSEISTLRNEGNGTEADVIRDEELAKIKETADDLLARAQSGEDFDALIEEYGEDPGMVEEPNKTYGYLVYEGAGYVEEFEAAALALENEGDISDLVVTDYGYHIIKYDKDGKGAVPFETVKDDIMESQLKIDQNYAYTNYVQELKDNATVKKHLGRLTNDQIPDR